MKQSHTDSLSSSVVTTASKDETTSNVLHTAVIKQVNSSILSKITTVTTTLRFASMGQTAQILEVSLPTTMYLRVIRGTVSHTSRNNTHDRKLKNPKLLDEQDGRGSVSLPTRLNVRTLTKLGKELKQ